MFFYSTWIQKRREQRKLLKEAEARKLLKEAEARKLLKEAEARKLLEEAEAQKERDYQQTQALFVTLHKLQRTMGPKVAAQVYNSRFCPLTNRLPDELLLCIFDFLCDDVIALHCLRSVSKTFRRILNRRSIIWRDEWYRQCLSPINGDAFYLRDIYSQRFRRYLQRDGRCNDCRRWNDAHSSLFSEDCKLIHSDGRWYDAVTNHLAYRAVSFCNACNRHQDVSEFCSHQLLQSERRCLAQQGSVQLCEHEQITWASIKAHIMNWQKGFEGSRDWQGIRDQWQRCFDSFNIECHDPSHDTRCTTSEAPTWPRACLRMSTRNSDFVVLNLQWRPHSRIDALALTADGRIPVTAIGTLFQKLRSQGPIDNLCSPCRPGALPEMAFFSPSSPLGRYVYYMPGEDDGTGPPPKSWLSWTRFDGSGTDGRQLDITPHYPTGASSADISSQCLVANYEKEIEICNSVSMCLIRLVKPTFDWCNAIDPRTYPNSNANLVRPQCRDVACFNYYQRRREVDCHDQTPFSQGKQ